MKLTIRDKDLQRRTAAAWPRLAPVGAVLVRLLEVRRVSLRIRPRHDEPDAELVIVRRRTTTAYRLRGRLARWAEASAARLDRWLRPPVPTPPHP